MDIPEKDQTLLRRLAEPLAEAAALSVHAEKAEMWRRCNQLQSVRPMVWINEICWHEMNVEEELTLRCEHPWARDREDWLRKTLYQWRHLPADMVLSPFLPCLKRFTSTRFGIDVRAELAPREGEGLRSRHFHRQIHTLDDVAKITDPVITPDAEGTREDYETLEAIFGDILPVRIVGLKNVWFAPWDLLIRLYGVQDAMIDLVMQPELVHAAMSRLVDAYLAMLDQYEQLGLLDRNDDNTRIGSGAYGYTDELPGQPFDPEHVTPANMWGCATAQIFSEVSPEMHEEFALKHEMRWLRRWGLTYYGCCEPLDIKMDILRRVPNLRKVSMSPWIKVARAAEKVAGDYVFSHKPNPAVLAEDRWRPEQARQNLREVLDGARDCHVEVILKDISTVRNDPQRLWDWARIAMEVVEEDA